MIIRRPNPADWEKFISLAEDEDWRVPNSETTLFMGPWSEYVHVLDDKGFCGLATAVAYEKCAWIGNLIVPYHCRGNGYGTHLFKSVLVDLNQQGATSVWLTASEQGRAIYQREGFSRVGTIERWVLPKPETKLVSEEPLEQSNLPLLHADLKAWGESRSVLLSELSRIGQVFSVGKAASLLQLAKDIQVVGPWYSDDVASKENYEMMRQVVAAADPAVALVADVVATPAARSLFESCGFACTGRTTLMVYGEGDAVDLSKMVSLASLGSVG